MSFKEYIDPNDVAELKKRIGEAINKLPSPINSRLREYILTNTGKMLRPILIINTAKKLGAVGAELNSAYIAAIVVESLHNMTLIHDDIIDEAPLRRGLPSYHELHGQSRAIHDGDVLHAYALTLIDNQRLLNPILDISYYVGCGNAIELEDRITNNFDFSEEHVLNIMRYKTAVVFFGCIQLGCIAADREDLAEEVKEIILDGGIAFQIQDDILDFSGKQEKFGKESFWDIQESKRNLFLYYTLLESSQKDRLIKIFKKEVGSKTQEEINFVLEEFHKVNNLVVAKRDEFLESCLERLDGLVEETKVDSEKELFEFLRMLIIYLCTREK